MTARRSSWPSVLLPGLLLVGVLAGTTPGAPSQASQDSGRIVELQITER